MTRWCIDVPDSLYAGGIVEAATAEAAIEDYVAELSVRSLVAGEGRVTASRIGKAANYIVTLQGDQIIVVHADADRIREIGTEPAP